jgi:hypothetical protein
MHPLLDIPDQVDVLIQGDRHGFAPGNDGILVLFIMFWPGGSIAILVKVERNIRTILQRWELNLCILLQLDIR